MSYPLKRVCFPLLVWFAIPGFSGCIGAGIGVGGSGDGIDEDQSIDADAGTPDQGAFR